MSLRWRITLLLAAVALAVSTVAAYGAHRSAAAELTEQTDDFLRQRAREFTADEGRRFGGDRRAPGRFDPRPRLGIEAFVDFDSVTQIIDAGGDLVVGLADQPTLPVTASDLQVLDDGDGFVLRNVEIDGTDYRMITAALPRGNLLLPEGGAVQIARDVGESNAVLADLRGRLVVLAVGATAIAAGAGWLIARRTTRPVEELRDSAHHIAETQDLSTPVPGGGSDEIGSLAESFNAMLRALETSRRQQHRLVMDASHELRTPLTSLRTNIELLERADDLGSADRADLLGDVNAELHELTTLVSELVELATDRSSSDEPIEAAELAEVARGVADRFERRIDRPIAVRVTDPVSVMIRRSMIERAVSNLVDNAVKYGADGPIEIDIRGSRLTVDDHGPGIAESDRARVFERFYRTDEARPQPGSGLGLSIVQQIVAHHGGEVHVGTTAAGGASVGFTLPPAAAAQSAP